MSLERAIAIVKHIRHEEAFNIKITVAQAAQFREAIRVIKSFK